MKKISKLFFLLLSPVFLFGQDYFEPLGGPQGTSDAFAICHDSSGYLYITNKELGVMRSSNHGDTWEEINDGFTKAYVFDLACASNGDLFMAAANQLYKLPKGTTTWIPLNDIDNLPYITEIEVSPNGDVFVLERNRVHRSQNGGLDFEVLINTGIIYLRGIRFFGGNKNYVFGVNGFEQIVLHLSDDGSIIDTITPDSLLYFNDILYSKKGRLSA